MKNKGFSILEILVALGIILLLTGITFGVFYKKYNSSNLEKDVENAVSLINKAKSLSSASYNNNTFGIRVTSSALELFKGTSYNDNGSDYRKYDLTASTASTSLSNGATSFYFRRLSGEPTATGTITFTLNRDASSTKTVIINATGLTEVSE